MRWPLRLPRCLLGSNGLAKRTMPIVTFRRGNQDDLIANKEEEEDTEIITRIEECRELGGKNKGKIVE